MVHTLYKPSFCGYLKGKFLYRINIFYTKAPHMLYPQILDDSVPAEREVGIQMGLRVLASCDEVWICGERISHGMGCEIAEAERLGIPIRNISTEQIKGGIAMKQYGIWARQSAGSICGKEREIELEEAPSSGMKLQL